MSATTDIPGLVSYLVTSLVDNPEAVSIQVSGTPNSPVYEVTVHPDDVGKVIGRQGRIIKAMRTLVRAAASVDGTEASVEVLG
jgi:hypothetical protein